MKKLFLFLVVMISVSNLAFAQNEVRGVETKLAKYEGPRYYSDGGACYLWFGFQFTNLNSIPVSVDVELYYYYHDVNYSRVDRLETTKTFVLESKETYIWKFEHNTHFHVCYDGEERETLTLGGARGGSGYYVRYKAYKLE